MNKTHWVLSSAMILAALAAVPMEAAGRDRANAMKNGPLCLEKINELKNAREKLDEKKSACEEMLDEMLKVAIEINKNIVGLYKKKEDQEKLEKLDKLEERRLQLYEEYYEAEKAEDNMTIEVNKLEESVKEACGKQ